MTNEEVIHLLWTGGWDSTFRLLYLLLVEKRRLQPYYVIDETRLSSSFEEQAMQRIREQLFERYPQTEQLLLPTQISKVSELDPDEHISRMAQGLKKLVDIGVQYDWLGRFAQQRGLEALEICDIRRPFGRCGPFARLIFQESEGEGHERRMRARLQHPDAELLRPFRFPTLHLCKLDMKRLAKQHGFYSLMELTWFCHRPRSGGPCGACVPCNVVVNQLLWERMPLAAFPRNAGYRLKKRVKKVIGALSAAA